MGFAAVGCLPAKNHNDLNLVAKVDGCFVLIFISFFLVFWCLLKSSIQNWLACPFLFNAQFFCC